MMGRWTAVGLAVVVAGTLAIQACGGANEPDPEDYVLTPVEMEGATCYVLQTSKGAPRGVSCVP